MKQITPMTRLKDTFKKVDNIVSNLTKIHSLSKSKPKYKSYGEYTKGVESDFIKIYEVTNDKSFAFTFNGITSDTSKTLITTSIKIGDNIISTVDSFDQFKNKLKSLLSVLEVLNSMVYIDEKSLLDAIDKNFEISTTKINPEDVAEDIIKNIGKEIKSMREEIHSKKSILSTSNVKLDVAKHMLSAVEKETRLEVDYDEKYNVFLKAQKIYLEAKAVVESKTREPLQKVQTLESVVRREEYNINNLNRKIDDIIKVSTKSYSPIIRKAVAGIIKN